MAKLIQERPDFELLMQPDSNVVLYRYRPADGPLGGLTAGQLDALNRLNEQVHKAQRQAGRTYVSRTTLFNSRHGRGEPVVALRAVVANPLTTDADLAAVLQEQTASVPRHVGIGTIGRRDRPWTCGLPCRTYGSRGAWVSCSGWRGR